MFLFIIHMCVLLSGCTGWRPSELGQVLTSARLKAEFEHLAASFHQQMEVIITNIFIVGGCFCCVCAVSCPVLYAYLHSPCITTMHCLCGGSSHYHF